MKLILGKNSTQQQITIFIQDSSASTKTGLTGIDYDEVKAFYYKTGEYHTHEITLVDSNVGIWQSGGFTEIDAANMPGFYQLQLPDIITADDSATLADNAVVILVKDAGSNNVTPVTIEIQLTENSLDDLATADDVFSTCSGGGGGAVTVAAGGITAASFANDSITAAVIANGAIDASTFAAGAIDAAAIADSAIDIATFAADVKTGAALKANVEAFTAGTITTAAFAAGAITSAVVGASALDSIDTTVTIGTPANFAEYVMYLVNRFIAKNTYDTATTELVIENLAGVDIAKQTVTTAGTTTTVSKVAAP